MGRISFNHSWAVGETIAIKRVDKSIRVHHASTLTKEANVFFGLNDLSSDKARKVKMTYDGKEFEIYITVIKRNQAPPIGRVGWYADFNKIIEETSALGNENDLTYLQFEKISDSEFNLTIIKENMLPDWVDLSNDSNDTKYWVAVANPDYKYLDEFRDYHYIDWDKNKRLSDVNEGDYVYLYETEISAIRFKFIVTKSPVPNDEMTDTTEYGGTNTRESGSQVFRMSPVGYCNSELLQYKYLKEKKIAVNQSFNARPLLFNYLETFFTDDDEIGEKKALQALESIKGPSTKMKSFIDYLKEYGLYYPVETIENFLLSLKVKQFLILSGGSGNGKTKMSQLYGEYLSQNNTSDKKLYSIIPVGSNWTEDRFIIGYKNALTGKYCSTKTLDIMIDSNTNEKAPHLLILDEMNLSHVERYFSDVLSSMESKEPISLESDGTIPNEIRLNDNLFIIGTINVDETTYSFSPKVLDRANVIEFNPAPISKYLKGDTELEQPSGDINYLQNCMAGVEVRKMNAPKIINKMICEGTDHSLIDSMISVLNSLQNEMEKISMPFGFRTIDEIFRFMYVSWVYSGKGNFKKWSRFFDAQIKQKILPKIHGNMNIRDCLISMERICKEHDFRTSAEKLGHMVEILDKQRYVSFNN